MTPAELADKVKLTRSAMTGNLDALERAGHIARAVHPEDRRKVAVTLTPSGRQFTGERLPKRYRSITRAIGCLTVAERDTMIRVYRKVLNALSDIAEAEA